jgi:hypothetical protein
MHHEVEGYYVVLERFSVVLQRFFIDIKHTRGHEREDAHWLLFDLHRLIVAYWSDWILARHVTVLFPCFRSP